MSSLQSRKEISTVLIDDEEVAIHRLKKMLTAYPSIRIVGEATNGNSAVELINTLLPELVFLDIQMPGLNGFEVLTHLEYTPLIVFITAYEEYAVKAFEKNSIDYLLKPVEDERLSITIERITKNETNNNVILLRIKQLISKTNIQNTISTIPVKVGNKINLIHVADICFFEAKDKYVFIHTVTEEKLVDYSLTYLQDRLPAEYVRIHRSYVINKLKIKEIQKYFKGTYIIVMNDHKNSKIKSSYSYSEDIRTKLLLP